MLIGLNKFRKVLPGILLLFYVCSFSDATVSLVDRVSSYVLNASLDFPCKGHGCGCTTALRCLTNCCCDKKTLSEQKVDLYICGSAVEEKQAPKEESCCASSDAKDKESIEEKHSPADSANEEGCSINQGACGFTFDDALFKQQKPQLLTQVRLEYLSANDNSVEPPPFSKVLAPKDVYLAIDKVPIIS